jgi:hypothetical protein
MTEFLILLALLMLIVTHAFLVKGCYELHRIIPKSSNDVASEASRITDILDEVADLIHSALENISPSTGHSPAPSIQETLLTGLISKFTMPQEHGPFTEIRQVHEDNPPKTLETENQLD